MRFPWCICDMDGTLLDSRNILPEKNVEAVRLLMQSGTEVILATGRSDLMVAEYVHRLGIKAPVIACNGGIIRNAGTGEVLYKKAIEPERLEDVICFCNEMNYQYMVYTMDTVIYSTGNKKADLFREYNSSVAKVFRVPLKEFEDGSLEQQAFKIMLTDVESSVVDEMEVCFNNDNKLSIVSSERGLIDIMASNTSKGGALLHLAGRFGLDLAKTVVFGDNYNDISMFAVCGLPIAVGNAEEAVKQAAKTVTLSNDEAGVAYAIHRYIL